MFKRTSAAICLVLALSQLSLPNSSDNTIRLTVPAAPWTLRLPSGGFVIAREQVKPDGRHGYFSMQDKQTYLSLSLFIEPVDKCSDSKSCRDMVWKLGNPAWENPQNIVMSKIGDVHFFEFLMPSFRGQPVQQQNMYAQFVVDGFWVDMHISKILYKPEEHKLFEDIIKSVKFETKKSRGAM
jgi:hypothetical protein